jgi:5-methylcytosine-specific restriction endonuclease McrA
MIALEKSDKPNILKQNEENWTIDYIQLRQQDAKNKLTEGRYRHQEIKAALIAETKGKCAFCESQILGTQFGDVEHLRPKRLHPELFVAWENLTLACAKCNNFKSDIDGIVNPYIDRISDHLGFLGPMATKCRGSISGNLTITQLRLNRDDLITRRASKLADIQNQIDLLDSIQNDTLKSALEFAITENADCDKEFSAYAKQYIRDMGLGYLFDVS